jgi:hypothetical protein
MKVKEPNISPKVFAHDYSAERRGRDVSCISGLQFRACRAITAEAVAKAPSRSGIATNQRTGKHERCLTSKLSGRRVQDQGLS